MPLELTISPRFKKDYKTLLKNGADLSKLDYVINKLINKEPLEAQFCDHPLKGKLKNYRDCHIKSDLVLLYQISQNGLFLVRLGSHSSIFKGL